MATFQYIAMDAQGKEQRGTVDAADRAQAIAAVRAAGLFPSSIGEVKSGGGAAAKKPAAKNSKDFAMASACPRASAVSPG